MSEVTLRAAVGLAYSACASRPRWSARRVPSSPAPAAGRLWSPASPCPKPKAGTAMAKLRVVLADDHAVVREG